MKTPALKFSSLLLVAAVAFPAGAFAADVDDQIEESFKSSYTYRTQLKENADVEIDAENGVVTLKGNVDNSDQKRMAEDTARSLPGVTSVRNELKVKSEPKESSDDWIALKVRSSLIYHRNVSLMDTDVKVMNGVVTLTGTADSEAEKSLAGEYAGDIKGVKKVDNRITVVSSPEEKNRVKDGMDRNRDRDRMRDPSYRGADRSDWDETRDDIDDASITAQVKGSLGVHRSTSAMRTEVSTKNGVVTLRGEAKSSAEKDLATRLARDIRGVRSVNNEMTVLGD